jgi:hypothetical protein
MLEFLHKTWLPMLGALCLAVGCLVWAMQTWAAPYLPLVICAVGVLGHGLYLKYTSDHSRRDNLIQLAPTLGVALMSGLWLLAPARSAAVDLAADMDVLPTHAVSADPSPAVRASACMAMLEGRDTSHQDSLQEAMTTSPALVVDCLKPALDAGLPSAQQIRHRTMRELSDKLESSSDSLTKAQAQRVVGQLAELQTSKSRIDLLQCALTSSADAMRTSCQSALDETLSLSDIVGPPETLSVRVAQTVLDPLTERVYFAKKNAEGSGSWATPANRRWVAALACGVAERDQRAASRNAAQTLGSITLALRCDWHPEATPSDFESLPWPVMCDHIEPDPAGETDQSDETDRQRLCSLVRPLAVSEAINDAHHALHAAISTFSLRASASEVANTPLGAGQEPTPTERYRAKIDSMTLDDIYGSDPSNRPASINFGNVLMAQIPGADRLRGNRRFQEAKKSLEADTKGAAKNRSIGDAKKKLNDVMAAGEFDIDNVVDRGQLYNDFGQKNSDKVLDEFEDIGDQ